MSCGVVQLEGSVTRKQHLVEALPMRGLSAHMWRRRKPGHKARVLARGAQHCWGAAAAALTRARARQPALCSAASLKKGGKGEGEAAAAAS